MIFIQVNYVLVFRQSDACALRRFLAIAKTGVKALVIQGDIHCFQNFDLPLHQYFMNLFEMKCLSVLNNLKK